MVSLKANEELWKNSNISPCKKYNFQKKASKRNPKSLQAIIITLL
jgi:hypothetical protein